MWNPSSLSESCVPMCSTGSRLGCNILWIPISFLRIIYVYVKMNVLACISTFPCLYAASPPLCRLGTELNQPVGVPSLFLSLAFLFRLPYPHSFVAVYASQNLVWENGDNRLICKYKREKREITLNRDANLITSKAPPFLALKSLK